VVGAIQGAEIWLSERAKEDIDRLGSAKHKGLKWALHEGVAMKGFPREVHALGAGQVVAAGLSQNRPGVNAKTQRRRGAEKKMGELDLVPRGFLCIG